MFREKDIIEKRFPQLKRWNISVLCTICLLYTLHKLKHILWLQKNEHKKSKIIKFTKKEKDAFIIRLEILYTVNSKLNAKN